jgi:predicted Zn-dependent protease
MSVTTGPTASVDNALAHASRLLDADPALAAEQAGEILRIVPGHPVAQMLLGAAHSARGRTADALAILEPLAVAQPRSPRTQLELGIALGRAGRGDEALAALRRAVALQPDLPKAWLALADHLAATGDEAAGAIAYTHHVRHSTRDPGLLAAAAALAENRLPDAELRLREHLKKAPTDVAAIRMFAELAVRVGRNDEAEALLARCLELAPGFHAARQNYALVLHRANRPERALVELDRLLAVDPANPGYRNLKAAVLCRIGDYAPAIALYDALLAEYPRNPRVWMSFGHALKTAGEPERAIAAYRRALAMDPAFGEVWWSLANLKTFRFTDADVAQMEGALARGDLADEHRLHLEFALGKAREDAREWAASFGHYAKGNALRRAQLRYRADETSAKVAHIRARYTREFFAQRAGSGDPAADPIFILGLPRAGSTLLEQILSSHPQVEGTMELPEVTSITHELRDRGLRDGLDEAALPYHAALAALDRDGLRALGARYLERTRIHRHGGAPLFIDKMPNNFMHVGLIHLMLPNAKIVDARRHPLACGFSVFKQHFARGQSFAYDLADIGRYYRDYVALMAHFDAVLPGRVHRVFHERMVEDTEGEVRALLAYCGLPFDDACLRFFENPRAVRTPSAEQVRQPIYKEGVDHWRHYEPWLGPLAAALGSVLDAYPGVPADVADDIPPVPAPAAGRDRTG